MSEQPQVVPSTHIWCLVCKSVQPYRNSPLPKASRQHHAGMNGDYLICCGCSTSLATVFSAIDVAAGEMPDPRTTEVR